MIDTRSRESAMATVLMHFVELVTGSVGKNHVTRGGKFTLNNERMNYGKRQRKLGLSKDQFNVFTDGFTQSIK